MSEAVQNESLLRDTYGLDPKVATEAQVLAEEGGAMKILKLIVGADGISPKEAEALRAAMVSYGVSAAIQRQVEAFDPSSARIEDVLATMPIPSEPAKKMMLYGAIQVASVDGYSERERELTAKAAQLLGLRDSDAHAFEALFRLRKALFGELVG